MGKYRTLGTKFDNVYRNDLNANFDEIDKDIKDVDNSVRNLKSELDNAVETVSNEAFNKVVDAAKITWASPVDTVDDLPTKYPDAEVGLTAMVRDTGKVYRYDGLMWKEIQDIDPTAINEVDSRLTSQLAQNEKKTEMILPLSFFDVDETGVGYSDSAFEQAITYATQNNIREIIGVKNATYKLLNPVIIPSNIRLDLKGALVQSYVDVEHSGAFELRGAVGGLIENSEVVNVRVDHMGTTKRVHSVYMYYTKNCYVSNVRSYNGGGKGVQVDFSENFTVEGIQVQDRTNVAEGHGYAVMITASSYGNVSNVRGYNTRHTVDLSDGSHHVNISNCFGFNNETATFSTHGQLCNNNVFTKCHSVGGQYGFAFGNASFAGDDNNIISNCTAKDALNVGFFVGFGSKNTIFENCIASNCQNNFSSSNSISTSFIGCKAVNSTNKAVVISNSTFVKISDLAISGTNQRGLSIESTTGLLASNLTFEGNTNDVSDGILNIENSKSIKIINAILDIASPFGSIARVSNGSSGVVLSSIEIKGSTPRYALEIITSNNVRLEKADITATVGIDTLRIGSSSADTITDIEIVNSNIVTVGSDTNKRCIRSWANGVKLLGSRVNGYSSFTGLGITIIQGNTIFGTLDVRATKGVMYTNNVGTYSVVELGEHDGVNIIRQNNIESVA